MWALALHCLLAWNIFGIHTEFDSAGKSVGVDRLEKLCGAHVCQERTWKRIQLVVTAVPCLSQDAGDPGKGSSHRLSSVDRVGIG